MEQNKRELIYKIEEAITANTKTRDNALLYLSAFFIFVQIFTEKLSHISIIFMALSILLMISSFFCTEIALKLQVKCLVEEKPQSKKVEFYDFINSICNAFSFIAFILGIVIWMI